MCVLNQHKGRLKHYTGNLCVMFQLLLYLPNIPSAPLPTRLSAAFECNAHIHQKAIFECNTLRENNTLKV